MDGPYGLSSFLRWAGVRLFSQDSMARSARFESPSFGTTYVRQPDGSSTSDPNLCSIWESERGNFARRQSICFDIYIPLTRGLIHGPGDGAESDKRLSRSESGAISKAAPPFLTGVVAPPFLTGVVVSPGWLVLTRCYLPF